MKKIISLRSSNKNRLQEIIKKGDKVGCVVFHKKTGFSAILEVTAVAHWGVYATLRGKDLQYYLKNYRESYKNEVEKRQFLVKWRHIGSIELI